MTPDPQRRLLLTVPLLAATLCGRRALAWGRETKVVLGVDGPVQRQIVKVLRARLPDAVFDLDPSALVARHTAGVYVSIGPTAFERCLASDLDGPLVCAFTSREAYTRLVKAAAPRARGHVTGIYAEASPKAQFQLIAALFVRRVSVGVLLSDATSSLERAIRQAAAAVELDVDVRRVSGAVDAGREIAQLRQSTVALLVPDSTLYKGENLRAVLESAYRRGQPVIGFSSSMVVAGTLASAFASIEDTIADLAELLESVSLGHTPEARYPKYWRVAINDSVADSQDVPISAAVRGMGSFVGGRAP